MQIARKQHGDITILILDGRLDQASQGVLEGELKNWLQENHKKLALDCTALNYVSSAGLRAFLVAAKSMKSAKRELVLFGLQTVVREVFQISGFDQILPIVDNESAALHQAA